MFDQHQDHLGLSERKTTLDDKAPYHVELSVQSEIDPLPRGAANLPSGAPSGLELQVHLNNIEKLLLHQEQLRFLFDLNSRPGTTHFLLTNAIEYRER